MGIRLKILFGFIILIMLMAIAVMVSIYQMAQMGKSVKIVLNNNYSSITAARLMTDALEKEEVALILFLRNERVKSIDSLDSAHNMFLNGLELAKRHITEHGEEEIVEKIDSCYRSFRAFSINKSIYLSENNDLLWYFDSVKSKSNEIIVDIKKLMDINNAKIYQTGTLISQHSQKAVMPGLITIMSALLFAFMFNFFITHYIVKPIIKITDGVDRFVKYGSQYNVSVETKDELFKLTTSIQNLFISHSVSNPKR